MIRLAHLALLLCLSSLPASAETNDVLPSWHDGAARQTITRFVSEAATAGSPGFVPQAQRIATFDNDGTLWAEQPMYFQLIFAIDRVRTMAADHPEWQSTEPFASILKGDLEKALAGGNRSILEIVMATHAGISTAEFDAIARRWIRTARHPGTGRLYTDMVYQPMLELLDYLRSNGFKTYIVSGGGIDFMRVWTEEVYGIPPEQVIGSSIRTRFDMRDGKPVLMRLDELDHLNDKEGKPVAINKHIGRRPVMAFGNSDGDLQMLQWTTSAPGPRMGVYIHHTDGEREWAYDRKSHIGKLDKGLDKARASGWLVVDMKRDWKTVYPPE